MFTIQLDCGANMVTSIGNFEPNTTTTQPFPVPNTFYSSNCTFSIVDYPDYYNAPSPVTVTISQPVWFIRPKNTLVYPINTALSVAPRSYEYISNNPITVVQECNPNNKTQYTGVVVGEDIIVMPPLNYMGTCTFSSLQSGLYDAANPNVTIAIGKGTITISTPSDGARVPAGTDTEMIITSAPDIDFFTVQLECGADMKTTAPVKPNIQQYFSIPKTFYGSTCEFSVIDYPDYYNAPDSVTATVTQVLIYSTPPADSVILRPDPSIDTGIFEYQDADYFELEMFEFSSSIGLYDGNFELSIH